MCGKKKRANNAKLWARGNSLTQFWSENPANWIIERIATNNFGKQPIYNKYFVATSTARGGECSVPQLLLLNIHQTCGRKNGKKWKEKEEEESKLWSTLKDSETRRRGVEEAEEVEKFFGWMKKGSFVFGVQKALAPEGRRTLSGENAKTKRKQAIEGE